MDGSVPGEEEEGDAAAAADEDEEVDDAEALVLLRNAERAFAAAKEAAPSADRSEWAPYFPTDLSACAPGVRQDWAHTSLARPFALRKHEIDPFVAALRAALARFSAWNLGVGASWRLLPSLEDSGSREGGERTFLALDIIQGRSELLALLAVVDRVLIRFGRPPYYAPPLLHVSVAEARACPSSRREGNVETGVLVAPGVAREQALDGDAASAEKDEDDEVSVFAIEKVEVKAGHFVFAINLKLP